MIFCTGMARVACYARAGLVRDESVADLQLLIVMCLLVFGGEKWMVNSLLTAVFCPGSVSDMFCFPKMF